MKAAVRFYSRAGNTMGIAQALADGAGVEAVSVDQPEAVLTEKVDVLFIGGALYAYGLDKHLKAYLDSLSAEQVGKAVVFSTSWVSKHALDLIRKSLEEKQIEVDKRTFYCKSKEVNAQKESAWVFAKSFL